MIKKYISGLLVLLLAAGAVFSDLNAGEYTVKSKSNISQRVLEKTDKKVVFKWHRRNLERHFYKHRAEFPEYKNVKEYGDGAVKFFNKPPEGTKFKHRSNGDRLLYHEKNNFFGAATKDGIIKTFFRPNRGIRYWNRQ